jgi:hypothetical protein
MNGRDNIGDNRRLSDRLGHVADGYARLARLSAISALLFANAAASFFGSAVCVALGHWPQYKVLTTIGVLFLIMAGLLSKHIGRADRRLDFEAKYLIQEYKKQTAQLLKDLPLPPDPKEFKE